MSEVSRSWGQGGGEEQGFLGLSAMHLDDWAGICEVASVGAPSVAQVLFDAFPFPQP